MNFNIKYAIFDLDGTLIDSKKGIVDGLKEAFRLNGLNVPEDKTIPVGPPLYDTIVDIFPGIEEDKIYSIVDDFRKLCYRFDLSVSKPFSQTVELLEFLKESGVKTYIATYKPKMFSSKILERHFNGLCTDIITPTELPTWVDFIHNNCTKTDIVEFLIKKHAIDCSCCFMAGDAQSDIDAANANNLISIAALYGYAEKINNADYTVCSTRELFATVINLLKKEELKKQAV